MRPSCERNLNVFNTIRTFSVSFACLLVCLKKKVIEKGNLSACITYVSVFKDAHRFTKYYSRCIICSHASGTAATTDTHTTYNTHVTISNRYCFRLAHWWGWILMRRIEWKGHIRNRKQSVILSGCARSSRMIERMRKKRIARQRVSCSSSSSTEWIDMHIETYRIEFPKKHLLWGFYN